LAAAEQGPAVVIWPETAVPGYYLLDEPLTAWVRGVADHLDSWLLVGAPAMSEDLLDLYNRAVLLDAHGREHAFYDKQHLVPFGEFVPLETWWPQLRDWLPPIGTFTAGSEPVVFAAVGHPPALHPFSVLICFEDLFAGLARERVQRGASWLAVITNDGWFYPAAAWQHAQASILRAVEFRRAVVRAANTGVSGCIDPRGHVQAVQDAQGASLNVAGMAVCEIPVSAVQTRYARWGEWLPALCALGLFSLWVVNRIKQAKSCQGSQRKE
jgi:apolipoprotein N-acyltransferase